MGLNLCLTYDSVHGQRGHLIVISNNTRGCFDRIAQTVLHLALLCLGIPKPALCSMIETTQEMDHYVCMAFGVLDDHYGYNPNHLPSQGALQGNGAGPARWFAIHSVLVKILHDAGFGYKVWTLI